MSETNAELEPYRDAKTGDVIDYLTAGDSHVVFEVDKYGGLPDGPLVCLRCGATS